ncbi:histidinol-phosphate aminotransferase [Bacillus ectoiniformans]|uniref:histidinol-phosphate transaminase n=1 Tax=Bacillus ectoiniformans TaxID=1494429 RepID=UPI00195ED23D|nr:histidinol-phosphate transaminase [Bacillus ectoiniformans]MBM7647988.1 histidinol-phosphate aminotransferase [Bacillus ectoiniformans]
MKWKQQIINLKAYQPGRSIEEVKKKYNLEKIVKLASNENPFGSSNRVKEFIQSFADSYAIYPDGYTTVLRTALSETLNVKENQLIFGNGSDEIIQIISRAMLENGKNTVMAAPTFPQYRHNAVVEGAEVREIPLVEGAHDLEAMAEAVDSQTAVVWLCSPNNPTGVYIKDQELKAFLDKMPEDVLVVLDEAYYEYVTADDYYNALEIIKEYPNVIVTRTFSKAYGLASFRVGYGFGSEEIIRLLEPVREPFNVNTLAQGAAAAALSDQAFVDTCRAENQKGLEQYYEFCEQESLSYYPSEGNFILIDFQCDSDQLFEYLMAKGYIIRSGKALGFPTSVRVTVGSFEENQGIIEAMKSFIAEKAIK